MLPFDNVYICPHNFGYSRLYIHKLSPVIKRAKNSTTFTSLFYKKVESKRFP